MSEVSRGQVARHIKSGDIYLVRYVLGLRFFKWFYFAVYTKPSMPSMLFVRTFRNFKKSFVMVKTEATNEK